MSRHQVPNRISDEHELVIGFDGSYRVFYGQFYDRRPEMIEEGGSLVVGGWPGQSGVTATERSILSEEDADAALDGLFKWAGSYHDMGTDDLRHLRAMLKREWKDRAPRSHELYRWDREEGCEKI